MITSCYFNFSKTTKISMANRPIAPAPGPGSTHLTGQVATATPHNIVTNVAKVPTGEYAQHFVDFNKKIK